jgi:hypothetical protein
LKRGPILILTSKTGRVTQLKKKHQLAKQG